MVVTRPAPRHRGRRRGAAAGRQRRRCGGRRRLCAGGRLSGGRQPRRRRLHDDAARRRPQDLPRFPREGAARRHAPTCTSTPPATSSTGLDDHGHLAVAVPGTVSGLEMALAKYGTMKRAELIAPAIRFAEQGFVLDAGRRRHARRRRPPTSRIDPATAAIFLKPAASPASPATGWCRRTSAATLRQIAEAGAAGFYKGPVARAIVASSSAGKGLITPGRPRPLRDARAGAGRVRLPRLSHRLGAAAELRRRRHLRDAQHPRGLSAQGLGLPLGRRRARADRGDAPRLRRPQQLPRRSGLRHESARRLLDKAYAARIRAAHRSAAGRAVDGPEAPASPPHEGSNTTHYSIVDGKGNAVSVTYTLNDWFGAKVTAAGTGVLLNNEMDDFTAKLGAPNIYGLVQGERTRSRRARRRSAR